MTDNFLELKNVSKKFTDKHENIVVLNNLNLKLPTNRLVALTGPSGSGKSTLIHLLALLDTPDTGSYSLSSSDNLFSFNDKKKSSYRKSNLSIIFQNFNLISDLTAIENVMLPNLNLDKDKIDTFKLAKSLLIKVGLENRLNHRPKELSGSKEEIDQIIKQLTKLIEVIEVKKVNLDNTIERQLMLVKVICSPTKRTALLEIANIFKANIIHISDTFFIFEIFGSSEKVLNFQKIVKIYGTINVVKTGKIFIEK